jgi:hypothetical protein
MYTGKGMKNYMKLLGEARMEGTAPTRIPLVVGKVPKDHPGKGNAKTTLYQGEIDKLNAQIAVLKAQLEAKQAEVQLSQFQEVA